MSRMIFTASLGLALALVVGCGSKPEPTEPSVAIKPDGKGDPNATGGEPKPPPAVKATYELDTAKHAIPAGPVSGSLAGDFVVASARLEGARLIFEKPATTPGEPWQVTLDLPPEAARGEAFKIVVKPEDMPGIPVYAMFPKPISLKGVAPTKSLGWRGGCAITLELGKLQKGRVAGKIYLTLGEVVVDDAAHKQTFLAGTFEAIRPRQPNDPPGEEDVPFVNGLVTVKGAPADAPLTVGYAATPTPTTSAFGATSINLGEPVNPPRWVQVEHDKPRITSLIAGDGKNVPSKYEHSRLTPGRYLVFAGLKNGPVVWKWVTVPTAGTVTADLTIDATQTGGVEVTAPIEAVGKSVALGAPSDALGVPSLAEGLFEAVSGQMGLEKKVVARKALFTNLAPGKYEVRVAGNVRHVEIIAGKTVELDFDKPAPEPKKPPEPAPEPTKK